VLKNKECGAIPSFVNHGPFGLTLIYSPLESVVALLVKSDCFGRDIRKKGLLFDKAFEQFA
jgi:hypothetical protein